MTASIQIKKLLAFCAIVFSLTAAIRIADWRGYRSVQTRFDWVTGDANAYQGRAIRFIETDDSMAKQYENSLNLGRPLFIVYYATFFKLFGYNCDFQMSLFHILLTAFAQALLLYAVFRRGFVCFNRWTALGSLFLVAFNPLIMFHAPFNTTDGFSLSLLSIFLATIILLQQDLSKLWLTVVFAVIFHVREVTALTFVAYVAAVFLTEKNFLNVVKRMGLFIVLIAPWYIYLLSSPDFPLAERDPFEALTALIKYRAEVSGVDAAPFFIRYATNLFSPWRGHLGVFISDSGKLDGHAFLSIPYYVAMYFFAGAGIWALLKKKIVLNEKWRWFFIFNVGIYAVFHTIIGSLTYMRDRMLSEYIWIVLAVFGVYFIFSKLRSSDFQTVAVDSNRNEPI